MNFAQSILYIDNLVISINTYASISGNQFYSNTNLLGKSFYTYTNLLEISIYLC